MVSGQSLGTFYRRKLGMGKKTLKGWREENQRKPFIDAGAGLGSCPWAKINSQWQWDKTLMLAPARGRQPKSQLCWSNEPGDLRGLGPQWLLAGCGSLQAVYWNGVCVSSHPSRLDPRTIRSAGGTSHWTTPGYLRGVGGGEEKLIREPPEQQRDAWRGWADKTSEG